MAKSIIFVVDNLNIGGIQRLALDECYYCKDNEIDFKLVVLDCEPKFDNSMIEVDANYFKKNKFDINFLGKNNFKKVNYFYNLMKIMSKNTVFVCHTTSGAFIIRFAGLLAMRNVKILLWIHQFIFLSDKTQTYKRLFYSMSADKIFFGAKQFELDWIDYVVSRKILNILWRKKTQFSRIGIYLKRVLWSGNQAIRNTPKDFYYFTFASRIVHWKGLNLFIQITEILDNPNVKPIIMTSLNAKSYLAAQLDQNSECLILLNKNPSYVRFIENNVHIYPIRFDKKPDYNFGIGLNVLEFLALGIPSIISEDDFLTYPELKYSELIEISDWKNLDELLSLIKSMLHYSLDKRKKMAESLYSIISIEDHMNAIFREIPQST